MMNSSVCYDLKGGGPNLSEGTIPKFLWICLGKSQKASIRIVVIRVSVQTLHVPNKVVIIIIIIIYKV
jgi:hypothetical protein